MDKEKLNIFKKRGGERDIQREGLLSTEPRGYWVDDVCPQELEFHPNMQSLMGSSCRKWVWAELVGLECGCAIRCF